MSLRSPDAGSFESLLREVLVPVESLVRLSKYPDTEPYWSRGRYRFDGPEAGAFGTTYAASRLDVAFCESVIHESGWFDGKQFNVAEADVNRRRVVRLKRPAAPNLVLADFTGDALKRLGLNNDISSGDVYEISQAWALAIYDHDPKWDGILYVSRQNNHHKAVAIFERSGVAKKSARELTKKQLAVLCDQFNVALI